MLSFVYPFLAFNVAKLAGRISLGQTSWGEHNVMSPLLVKSIFSGLRVLNVTDGKCSLWWERQGAHRPDCPCQLFCVWDEPHQFIALEFRLPFVNLWDILVM